MIALVKKYSNETTFDFPTYFACYYVWYSRARDSEFEPKMYINVSNRLLFFSSLETRFWLDKVNSVVDVWYPGDAGGAAVSDILFGDRSPSGKLPITFPVAEAQLPLVYNHKPTGRGDDYTNLTGQPLFPFGFGLSYTTFDYTALQLDKPVIKAGENLALRFKIKNTGNYKGDEVVQLYLRDELASVARPAKELKAFQRVSLQPGEEKEIQFIITPWNADHAGCEYERSDWAR